MFSNDSLQAYESRHMISCAPPQKPPSLDDQEIVCIMRFAAARALSLVIPALAVFSYVTSMNFRSLMFWGFQLPESIIVDKVQAALQHEYRCIFIYISNLSLL
jgi:hypothetical protein